MLLYFYDWLTTNICFKILKGFMELVDPQKPIHVLKGTEYGQDIHLFSSYLAGAGVQVKFITPADLQLVPRDNDRLSGSILCCRESFPDTYSRREGWSPPAGLEQIHQVALELHQRELEALGGDLLKALAPISFNDFRTVYLVHDKRMLGIIPQELDSLVRDHRVITSQEAQLLKSSIVPTFIPGSEQLRNLLRDIQLVKETKDDFILKPVGSGKGKAIVFGTDVTTEDFIKSLQRLLCTRVDGRLYVVQKLIKQAKYDVVVPKNDSKTAVASSYMVGTILMANGEHLGMGAWRTSPHRICAVSRGGAWMCSLIPLPARDDTKDNSLRGTDGNNEDANTTDVFSQSIQQASTLASSTGDKAGPGESNGTEHVELEENELEDLNAGELLKTNGAKQHTSMTPSLSPNLQVVPQEPTSTTQLNETNIEKVEELNETSRPEPNEPSGNMSTVTFLTLNHEVAPPDGASSTQATPHNIAPKHILERIAISSPEQADSKTHIKIINTVLEENGLVILDLRFQDPTSNYLLSLVLALQAQHSHNPPLTHSSTRGHFWDVKPLAAMCQQTHAAGSSATDPAPAAQALLPLPLLLPAQPIARSETTSHFPWHTDCSYVSHPPRFFALQVLQADRGGGGTLSVLRLSHVLRFLAPATVAALRAAEFQIRVPLEFAAGTESIVGPLLSRDEEEAEMRW